MYMLSYVAGGSDGSFLFGGYYVYALVVDFGGALYVYFYKGGLIW